MPGWAAHVKVLVLLTPAFTPCGAKALECEISPGGDESAPGWVHGTPQAPRLLAPRGAQAPTPLSQRIALEERSRRATPRRIRHPRTPPFRSPRPSGTRGKK